jgi:hypothetical protein
MVFGHCYCRTWGQNAPQGPVNSRRQSVCLNLFGNGTAGYNGAWLSHLHSVTTPILLRQGIPLSFLLFLNYYTLFMGFKNIGASVGILTTAFLAGIALYISTERPQPLRMTTVDLIFLWYYMLTGLIIVITSVSSLLGAKIFIVAVTGLKLFVPLGVIGICVFILRRIKSNRLKPRIN